jgi:hypothetical protein
MENLWDKDEKRMYRKLFKEYKREGCSNEEARFIIIFKYIYNIIDNYIIKYTINLFILLLSLWVLYVFIMMIYYTFK